MYLRLQRPEKRQFKAHKPVNFAGFHITRNGEFYENHPKYRLSTLSHLAHPDGALRFRPDDWSGHRPVAAGHRSRRLHFVGPLKKRATLVACFYLIKISK